MPTYCPNCGRDIYATTAAHVCLRNTTFIPLPREQTLEGMIEAKDTEIARLTALLAEAREGLKACEAHGRVLHNMLTPGTGGGDADDAIDGIINCARVTLAKLGA